LASAGVWVDEQEKQKTILDMIIKNMVYILMQDDNLPW
jgi:hypothetical protein